jgi:hypothetical protein
MPRLRRRLADEPRPGAPATFTPEQICSIVALACEPPEKSELPLSHWSQSELAREAVRRGFVGSISHGSVGRFLKEADLNRIACAAGSRPSRTRSFESKGAEICAIIKRQQDVRTVSVDEMMGVQALERAAPDLPVQPGKVAWLEFEYIRHGTQTVIAAFDVTTGQVTASVGETRTEQDYANFLDTLFAAGPPTTEWRVIVENAHVSESVVRLVARLSIARAAIRLHLSGRPYPQRLKMPEFPPLNAYVKRRSTKPPGDKDGGPHSSIRSFQ